MCDLYLSALTVFPEAKAGPYLIWNFQNLEMPGVSWVLSTYWPNGQTNQFLHVSRGFLCLPCQITSLRGENSVRSGSGPTLRRSPLGLMLCCGHLEILIVFKQGALYFHFALGPTDYVAGPVYAVSGGNKLREELCLHTIYGT